MPSLRVLVVESNPADAYIVVEALKQAGITEGVVTIEDSQHALTHLQESGAPDLLLLDLNLTPLSGFEVLGRVREDAALRAVPIIIMSGSRNTRDVKKAYELGANCYLTKPTTLDHFFRAMKVLTEFWGDVATLPPK